MFSEGWRIEEAFAALAADISQGPAAVLTLICFKHGNFLLALATDDVLTLINKVSITQFALGEKKG